MSNYLSKLVEIGGPTLSTDKLSLEGFNSLKITTTLKNDLFNLLNSKNGFYAFESALHIFPSISDNDEVGIFDWNSKNLWIDSFKGLISESVFFAEDIFGVQFCILKDGIYSFDPETAQFTYLANSINNWSKLILSNYEEFTGFPIAHSWQKIYGSLKVGKRLIPKTPFVLGGDYEIENLISINSVKGMRLRANLAVQIRDLPDGSKIKWEITD